MTRKNVASADDLLGPILRSVSRSFYVSIRLLPRRLRKPVGLAYLLARATDTLADTVQVPARIRRDALNEVSSAIQRDEGFKMPLELEKTFIPLQSNEAERTLIARLPECLQILDGVDAGDQSDIRVVLDKIAQAQTLDLETFGDSNQLHALATAADLRNYTYLIAGCVGEFWTHVCSRHAPNFAELPSDEMLELGRSYGRGLQLINILRDAGTDLSAGRCYFPVEDLEAVGLKPSEISGHPARFAPIFGKWLEEAENGLRSGMKYVRAIRDRRLRGATVLPALIGARTISLLRAAEGAVLKKKIKVPRQEVRGMIASVAITLSARSRLDAMFQRLSK